jgi:precorrin-8X/cobalt-precorrin-8 methylmutase
LIDSGIPAWPYSRVPAEEIESTSFKIIRDLLPDLSSNERELAVLLRIVHTTGDPGITEHVKIHPRAIESGLEAIRGGAPIIVDVKMVAVGINPILARKYGCQVKCGIDDPDVFEVARARRSTRSAAAMLAFKDQLDGSIVAIGNAPTALFAVLDLVESAGARPALIVGTPVGFVGAAEAKAELTKRHVPFITIEGTRGGSAIAAAIVNALLKQGSKQEG